MGRKLKPGEECPKGYVALCTFLSEPLGESVTRVPASSQRLQEGGEHPYSQGALSLCELFHELYSSSVMKV